MTLPLDDNTGLPERNGELVVKPMTPGEAEAAVNATLDSADESDLRELANSSGDLHVVGSNEVDADKNRNAALTADELALKLALAEAEENLELQIDKAIDDVLATPEVDAMIQAALEDAEDVTTEGANPVAVALVTRIVELEKKISTLEALLNEFRDRALKAFKHAGFKF